MRQYNELISKQFAIACHLSQHPCHQHSHIPPDDRPERRRSRIGRLWPNIKQYITDEPPSSTSCKSAISSILLDAVRTAIESSSRKLFNGRPPPIATAEQTLSRKTRPYWHNCAPVTAEYLDSTWHKSTWQRATFATTVVTRIMTHTTTSSALRRRPHWQLNHYGLWRQKPRNVSTWWLMRRANLNNNMRAVSAVNWDWRLQVANSACRDEELRLLSCCPCIMEWTTTNIRCSHDEQLVNLRNMLASGKRLLVLASCLSINKSVFQWRLV